MMKRTLALLTALLLCLSLCACNNKDEAARAAFADLNSASELIDQFSHDVRQVWNEAINDNNAQDKLEDMAEITYLHNYELSKGAAMIIANHRGGSYEDHTGYSLFSSYSDDYYRELDITLMDACIQTVINGYDISGKTGQIRASLDSAANYLNEIDDVDYTHWSDLKGYYESCSALFEFCKDPRCSFEQFDSIRNEHINAIRQYKASLSALL